MSSHSNLLSYPTYKPSGIPWLETVPEHWSATSAKHHYSIQLGKMLQNNPKSVDDVEVNYLKAQHVQWFHVETSDAPTMWASPKDLKLFGINQGDLLVCEGGEGGRCGIVKQIDNPHIIQNALHRVRPLNGSFTVYLQYVLRHIASSGWFDVLNNKATIAHFTSEKFNALKIPLPPLSEQRAIAGYLDYMDHRITRYIEAKERLIGLLEEQKRVVINQAVTRGLDPDVRMKVSGVEWLGDVPAHWEVRRLKTMCRMKSGDFLATESIETAGEYPVYGGNGIRGYTTNYNHDGDFVLVGRQGALCGNVHVAKGRFWATEHAVVATLQVDHNVGWFGAILEAMNLNQYSIAAAQPGLAVERILNLHIPVPNRREQEQIAGSLKTTLDGISNAMVRCRRQIELVNEYRTRLIADVVTGKLDVREAAADLPNEMDKDELSDRLEKVGVR